MPTTPLLLLTDARMPNGAHAHSGGLEAAVTAGVVSSMDDLDAFLRGRLITAGRVAAGLAAAAARHALMGGGAAGWARLTAEADARAPSPAQRAASRAQGRSLLRAARAAWPSPLLDELDDADPPHHPLVLGAVAVAAGCGTGQAALAAAYASVTGPASAAVRLLSLDPMAVHGLLARLADQIDAVAVHVVAEGEPPADSSPMLDLFAQTHARAEVRFFGS